MKKSLPIGLVSRLAEPLAVENLLHSMTSSSSKAFLKPAPRTSLSMSTASAERPARSDRRLQVRRRPRL